MSRYSEIAIVGGGLALAAGALYASTRVRGPVILSPLRQKVLALLHQVVPSVYPDERFRLMAPAYAPDDPAWRQRLLDAHFNPDKYTTCPELPRWVGSQIGVNTRGGLESIRSLGKGNGRWIVAGGSARPMPGDFYGIDNADHTALQHVGIIVDANSTTWHTADAGERDPATQKQATAYLTRTYDPSAVTLGGPLGPRPLGGWYRID